MSNPPGPPHGDPSQWGRPAGPTAPIPTPSESATHQIPTGDRGQNEATTRIPGPPPGSPPGSQDQTTPVKTGRRRSGGLLRDPLTLILVAVIVVALALAGLIGTELFARHIADAKVVAATECVVQDQVSASFGVAPPFLWQHITGRYTNISIQTAGNQIKEAKEMKAELNISDVRLHSTADSSGTIGALDATLTWPTEGIKETIQTMVPLLGKLVSDVTTNASAGTVELNGAFGLASVTVKPQVVNGGLSLEVQDLTGLGSMALPKETIQPALDEFATELTKKYPLGIHADSIEVTDTGVIAHFSTRNATMPAHSTDPCFANL
ncbi:MAG TPA: DUF2993 domain-containing protein [Mycobacterium sp.]|nr:DUF2993 domain-containing protein [Mycobacterium sp.]